MIVLCVLIDARVARLRKVGGLGGGGDCAMNVDCLIGPETRIAERIERPIGNDLCSAI